MATWWALESPTPCLEVTGDNRLKAPLLLLLLLLEESSHPIWVQIRITIKTKAHMLLVVMPESAPLNLGSFMNV